MPNQLAAAISPYLRSHAGNPVEWRQWGPEPFAEAASRGVPVMVSIGYSTCHWCHVMARESFSDPAIAAQLSAGFVAVKVDREEHPDVDTSYLAAASAFTSELGWPLTVFVTPEGRAFYAGTYYPPVPVQGRPSFSQVLDAVSDAWTNRRDEVEQNAAEIAEALSSQALESAGSLPTRDDLARVVSQLASFEDDEFGGFGRAPKFPIAPVQLLLVELAAGGSGEARDLVRRTLSAMAASPLRDEVEGGFFRYAVRRDWHEPHYERMLYDNALLLRAYSRLSALTDGDESAAALRTTEGVADFLLTTLQRDGGGFGSGQDSESDLGEGGYYALDRAGRAAATPPKVDEKVLTGWNGLAIGALAEAGARHSRDDWTAAAVRAAEVILTRHVEPEGLLLRAATERGVSTAVATLEDYGMLADGLLRLGLATGEVRWAAEARRLVDACLSEDADDRVFAAPGSGDPVLAEQGLGLRSDPSEGAYPSGLSAIAAAAFTLSQLVAEPRYRLAAERAVALVGGRALESPTAFGAMLTLAAGLADPATQLVVVTGEGAGSSALASFSAAWFRPGTVTTLVTGVQADAWSSAGFDLFDGRVSQAGLDTAYLCRDFVCRLPVTTLPDLIDTI